MPKFYRPRIKGKPVSRLSLSVRPETAEALTRLRGLFGARYPNLSVYFEKILVAEAHRLESDPEALAEELAIFESKYGKAKTAQEPRPPTAQ
jgi:hypothetical protein